MTAPDSKGRAVYVVDVLTGSLVWRYSYAEDARMKYSIPSDVARLDADGNGKIDQFYVGDVGGQVWRFDIGDSDTTKWSAKFIFNSNPEASDHRKIFYPPDITLEKDNGDYAMVFIGTGDREHPKNTTVVNRLYGVKDKNLPTILTENDLKDMTFDLLQDPTTPDVQKNAILSELRSGNGWYIKLQDNQGEKSLSSPVVIYKIAYYTTFSPTSGSETDPCFVGEGTARMYALDYKTANAVFNLDDANDLGGPVISQSDRSTIIGTAIPSLVIVTVFHGTATGYVGVGGGVYRPKLWSGKTLIPIYWRLVF